MLKKEITFEMYDKLCERYHNSHFKCGDWWPPVDYIKKHLVPRIEQNLEFLIWITETASEPKTEQEKESRTYINSLINETLIFVD